MTLVSGKQRQEEIYFLLGQEMCINLPPKLEYHAARDVVKGLQEFVFAIIFRGTVIV